MYTARPADPSPADGGATTPDRLVGAGLVLLEERGLAGISLRSIAAAAGVSHGAPRRYFPTYASLLSAIVKRGIAELDVPLRAALARRPARQGLVDAGVLYLTFARRRPETFALMTRHDLLAGAGGDLRSITGPWLAGLAAAIKDAGVPNPKHRAVLLWAAVHGLATLQATRALELAGAVADERLVEEAVDRML